ncbi:MAG: hypothetical protein ACRER8_22185 [Pseudomonas sp.]|uniref:hypothetical protein n=1 Tax=Pseudomonas sp. TaxID=306 RepID=UPI003D6F19F8
MSRNLFDIASTGLEDLYEVQDAFSNLQAIFEVMVKAFPADSTTAALGELGLLEIEAWANKVCQWSECMDNELDGFPDEAKAYQAKHLCREALRAGGAA